MISEPATSHSPLATSSTADQEVLVKVEGVSKKFCRSLKRSLWYGIGDIAGELNPFAGGKGHGVEGGGKPLDALQSTGAHGRSGQLAESHPQGSTCGARAATSVHVSSEGEGGTKGLKDEGLNGPEDAGGAGRDSSRPVTRHFSSLLPFPFPCGQSRSSTQLSGLVAGTTYLHNQLVAAATRLRFASARSGSGLSPLLPLSPVT